MSDYFERGEFDGSTVGREWNVGEHQRMLEKDQKEILHNSISPLGPNPEVCAENFPI